DPGGAHARSRGRHGRPRDGWDRPADGEGPRGPASRRPRPRERRRFLGSRPLARRPDPGDRVHQPDGEGPSRMSAVSAVRTTTLPAVEPHHSTPAIAFRALLLRDLAVLRKNLAEFVIRTIMQPLLFVFVFTYVF